MKKATLGAIALSSVATLGGCAQTTGGLAGNTAEQQCGALARADGIRVNEVAKSENVGGGQNLDLRVEDALGRRFNATCVYTADGARWLNPLPANAARR